MGGWFCFGENNKSETLPEQAPKRAEIQKVDEVKFKLKKARDFIKNFINAKNKDMIQIDGKIAEKVPAFK
jgi:hypothetical protein